MQRACWEYGSLGYSRAVDDGTLERMADLVVEFGANVQPGQRVHVGASIGQEALARAVAARCYRAGAVFVHVAYERSVGAAGPPP